MKVQKKDLSPKLSKAPVTAITQKVVDLLHKDDEVVGYLNKHHVKWLLMFTYQWFNVKKAGMAFDFKSTPKRIVITPFNEINGKLVKFSLFSWAKLWFKLKWEHVERDLPGFIELSTFKISFSRTPPKSDNVMGPLNDTTGQESAN